MSVSIKLPLRNLNLTVIQALQEKYPEAEVQVELHPSKAIAPLSEARFWKIIATLDWNKVDEDDDAVLEPAIAMLSAGSVRHLFEFANILSEKLYELDHIDYAKHIGETAWKPNHFFSADNFLYARCCVVANGKKNYNDIKKNPTMMPKDITFESLLYLPSMAYERKTNQKYDYTPLYPIETYSNVLGWINKNQE
jgi:Protein of unknown function (DUF4240)